MARSIKRTLSGWGNFPREEVSDFRPDSPGEMAPLLAARPVPSFIARGLGRSYGDAALNAGGGVIRQERLNRFIAWDQASGLLECEGGVSYEDLLDSFVPRVQSVFSENNRASSLGSGEPHHQQQHCLFTPTSTTPACPTSRRR